MRRLAWLIGVTALAGCDLDLTDLGGACTYERDLSESVSASSIVALLADVEAGDLEVRGVAGSNTIRVRARACSSDRRTVDEIDFELIRSNSIARLTSFVPRYDNARLDITIEVPADFDVEVIDLSGDIDIRNVFSVWIEDGSGHIDVRSIREDVIVYEDGSGDIDVEDVGGDFIVERDSSGSIRYRNVRGVVQLP